MSEPSAPELTVVDRAPQTKLTSAEQAAYTEFYKSNYDKVWRVSVKRCAGDRDRAEEVFQETFLLVARDWREVASMDPAHQQGWVFKSLEFKAYEEHRRRRRESPAGDVVDLFSTPAGYSNAEGKQRSADDVVADRVAYQQFLALAPTVLSERELLVVLMTYIYEFTQVETAKTLDAKEGTIRSDLSRAKRKLWKIPELQQLTAHLKGGRW